MSQVIGLMDCNSFYCEAERLFRPDLKGVPIVCLSNNDGCIVARCRYAKALGFKMGEPYFKAKQRLEYHGVIVFSSNYALYADISARVMSVLEQLTPACEVYSIDEAFFSADGISDLLGFGIQVRNTVQQWTGIGVGVGLAQTKTLAKLANYAAKKYPATGGVVDLTDRARQLRLMEITPVEEVWGVGRRITARLNVMGIRTALELAQADPKIIRRQFSVVLERTMAELNGEACLELDDISPSRKQIVSSRSFGTKIMELKLMRQAICEYASRAAQRLRHEDLVAKQVSVFIRTNGFDMDERQYNNMASSGLVIPTNDTRELVAMAISLLERIWRDGYRYAKGGVMLTDFYPISGAQQDLFASDRDQRSQDLMSVIDKINSSGLGRVFLAGQGTQQDWAMKRRFLSPAYTTRWKELPVAWCK